MPAPGYVLVELGRYYENIETPEEKYNTATKGTCRDLCIDLMDYDNDIAISIYRDWLNQEVFWEEYNASKRIKHDGKTYAFIKIEDIRGVEIEANQKAD